MSTVDPDDTRQVYSIKGLRLVVESGWRVLRIGRRDNCEVYSSLHPLAGWATVECRQTIYQGSEQVSESDWEGSTWRPVYWLGYGTGTLESDWEDIEDQKRVSDIVRLDVILVPPGAELPEIDIVDESPAGELAVMSEARER